jgi:hypothetical protein
VVKLVTLAVEPSFKYKTDAESLKTVAPFRAAFAARSTTVVALPATLV